MGRHFSQILFYNYSFSFSFQTNKIFKFIKSLSDTCRSSLKLSVLFVLDPKKNKYTHTRIPHDSKYHLADCLFLPPCPIFYWYEFFFPLVLQPISCFLFKWFQFEMPRMLFFDTKKNAHFILIRSKIAQLPPYINF